MAALKVALKTSAKLGITPWERKSLIAVRNMLATRAKPVKRPSTFRVPAGLTGVETVQPKFSMDYPIAQFECGTALCIGGWVRLFQLKKGRLPHLVEIDSAEIRSIQAYVDSGCSPALRPLYYPMALRDWNKITPRAAARAITRFLQGRGVDWKRCVRSRPRLPK